MQNLGPLARLLTAFIHLIYVFVCDSVSVFCRPTSEFIRVSRCFRKTMLAHKDTKSYTSSGRSPTSSLRDDSSLCSSVECCEVLTMGRVN
jgi:hypothetical protein